MDLLANYDSNTDEFDTNDNDNDDDDNDKDTSIHLLEPKVSRSDRRYLQAAPAISILTKQKKHGHELIVHHASLSHQDGTTALIITEPVQGPQAMDPAAVQQFSSTGQAQHNVRDIDERSFKKQRTNFQRDGKAQALIVGGGGDGTTTTPSVVVRTTLGYNPTRLQHFERLQQERQARPDFTTTTNNKNNKKEKEPLVYGSDDEAVYGIWAPPSKQEQWHAEQSLTELEKVGGDIEQLQPEQIAEREYLKEKDRILGKQQEETEQLSGFERLMERKMAHLLPPKQSDNESGPLEPSTTFHGPAETDYKGSSWMAPPSGLASIVSGATALEPDHHQCFVPKKCVHRFTGHNKGVQRIRLFPKTGHLLLSAGLDGKCKIWSTTTTNNNNSKQVMRTYEGHRAAVRDVQFNHDGSRFVSASFDRYLRLWDTESGTVLQTFSSNKHAVPYCVQFYPHDDNLFVVGGSDNKIVTYDCTTGEMTQEYNHHLAPVNAIVFCHDTDGSTKMVSSSDDKKVLVWEWDIGVPVKYISDPTMHSMPCLVMHPAQQYFVAQSLDNTICVFQANNRFALQKKKKFSGHQVAGYACEPAFSPDGQFLISGDGKGKLFIWDWKRSKILQKYKAHDKGPAIDCVWHPLEPSVLFTCGWDGVIKMWQ